MNQKIASIELLEILEDRSLSEATRDYRVNALVKAYKRSQRANTENDFLSALIKELKAYWCYRSPLMFVPQHLG